MLEIEMRISTAVLFARTDARCHYNNETNLGVNWKGQACGIINNVPTPTFA